MQRMFKYPICLLVLFIGATACSQESQSGALVIVGGGGTPDSVMEKLVTMGGQAGSFVVIPQASSRAESGDELIEFFTSFGAKNVSVLNIREAEKGLSQLDEANVIWIGGGNQNALMEKLPESFVLKIQQRFQEGCTIGGTSAGAAVMSERMITGEAELEGVHADATRLEKGLGLTSLIVDQHFHRRRRFNRLLSAVLDHSEMLGVGIDERTAVVVSNNRIEVLGESSVLIVDATNAEIGDTNSGQDHAAEGVKLHLLVAGQTFDLPQSEDDAVK